MDAKKKIFRDESTLYKLPSFDNPQEKFYQKLIVKHDKFYYDLKQIFEIVVDFIKEKKSILVGGTAIDAALKMRGKCLYAEGATIPDYDFLTPDNANDAYDLTLRLCRAGFSVSCMPALHLQTMKVMYMNYVIADITYCPKHIFEGLLTFKYEGLIFINQQYQYIDMHRGLYYPFENTTREVIFSRWKKDSDRYELLYSLYPLPSGKMSELSYVDGVELGTALFKNECLSGSLAVAYWSAYAPKPGLGFKSKFEAMIPKMSGVKHYIKRGTRPLLSIYSDDYRAFLKKLDESGVKYGAITYFNEIIGKMYRRIEVEMTSCILQIFDMCGSKVTAHPVMLESGDQIWIASPHLLMAELLCEKLFINPEARDVCETMYDHMRTLTSTAYSEKYEEVEPLFPNLTCYGSHVWSHSYIYGIRSIIEKSLGIKPRELKADRLDFTDITSENKEIKCQNPKGRYVVSKDTEIFNYGGERVREFSECTNQFYVSEVAAVLKKLKT